MQLSITETIPPNDPYAALIDALAAELARQKIANERQGDDIRVNGEIDLRALAFAVRHALTSTPG